MALKKLTNIDEVLLNAVAVLSNDVAVLLNAVGVLTNAIVVLTFVWGKRPFYTGVKCLLYGGKVPLIWG